MTIESMEVNRVFSQVLAKCFTRYILLAFSLVFLLVDICLSKLEIDLENKLSK